MGFLISLAPLVHSVGGYAALAGAIASARDGKYSADGKVNVIGGCSLPMTTLGVFILWLGWFGFNGGSQLALGSGADATAVADIFVNTTCCCRCVGLYDCK